VLSPPATGVPISRSRSLSPYSATRSGPAANGLGCCVATSGGARSLAYQPPHLTWKAAVHQLTNALTAEWADRGIRVNALAPALNDPAVLWARKAWKIMRRTRAREAR